MKDTNDNKKAFLRFEVTLAEKKAWTEASPGKLTDWVRETLNREAKRRDGNR